jgi:hypothetical protein
MIIDIILDLIAITGVVLLVLTLALKKMRTRTRIVLWIMASLCVVLLVSAVDVIPPRALTITRLYAIGMRIDMYVQEHGQLPVSLDSLPERKGYGNAITDAWKHPVHFACNTEDKSITLTSLGRDGKPGGKGDDADITMTIPLSDNGRVLTAEHVVHYSDKQGGHGQSSGRHGDTNDCP